MAVSFDPTPFFDASNRFYRAADTIDWVCGNHLEHTYYGTQLLDELRNQINASFMGLGDYADSYTYESAMSATGSAMRWLADQLRGRARYCHEVGVHMQQLQQMIQRQMFDNIGSTQALNFASVYSFIKILSTVSDPVLTVMENVPKLKDIPHLEDVGMGISLFATGADVVNLWHQGDHDPHDLAGTAIGGVGETALGTRVPEVGVGLMVTDAVSQVDQIDGSLMQQEGIAVSGSDQQIGNAISQTGTDLTTAGKNMDASKVFVDAGNIIWDGLPFEIPIAMPIAMPISFAMSMGGASLPSSVTSETTDRIPGDTIQLGEDVGRFGLSFIQTGASLAAFHANNLAFYTENILPHSPFSDAITSDTKSMAQDLTRFANFVTQGNPNGNVQVQ